MRPFLKYRRSRLVQSVISLCVICLVLTTLLLAGCSQQEDIPLGIDQSSPEVVIRSFYEAIESGNIYVYQALLDPADDLFDQHIKGFKTALDQGYSFVIQDLEIVTLENDGLRAKVRTYFSQRTLRNGKLLEEEQQSGDVLPLVNHNGRWYIGAFGRDAWLDESPE